MPPDPPSLGFVPELRMTDSGRKFQGPTSKLQRSSKLQEPTSLSLIAALTWGEFSREAEKDEVRHYL
jgi:hypothetical protein